MANSSSCSSNWITIRNRSNQITLLFWNASVGDGSLYHAHTDFLDVLFGFDDKSQIETCEFRFTFVLRAGLVFPYTEMENAKNIPAFITTLETLNTARLFNF